MMRMEDMMRFTVDKKARERYRKWLADPTTLEVIAVVEELNRPAIPVGFDQTVMANLYATQCAVHNTLKQLTRLDEMQQAHVEVAADYGTDTATDKLAQSARQ